jgi:prevent-host-death family protein
MIRASVSEAKARLSALLRRVQAGHEVVITDRGVPVARLSPIRTAALSPPAAALVARGVVSPPRAPVTRRRLRELPRPPKAPVGVSLLSALLAEREESR